MLDLWKLSELVNMSHCATIAQLGGSKGRWVIAKPLPCRSLWNRARLAWMVLTFQAEAFEWDEVVVKRPGKK